MQTKKEASKQTNKQQNKRDDNTKGGPGSYYDPTLGMDYGIPKKNNANNNKTDEQDTTAQEEIKSKKENCCLKYLKFAIKNTPYDKYFRFTSILLSTLVMCQVLLLSPNILPKTEV